MSPLSLILHLPFSTKRRSKLIWKPRSEWQRRRQTRQSIPTEKHVHLLLDAWWLRRYERLLSCQTPWPSRNCNLHQQDGWQHPPVNLTMGSEVGDVKHNFNKTVTDYIPASTDPPKTSTILAKADSGASSHYFMSKDQTILTDLRTTPFGPTVMLPNSTSNIQATHLGQLPFHPSFSEKAKTAHILDDITNSSLFSIGQLCDDNCIAVLDKKLIKIFKSKKCILEWPHETKQMACGTYLSLYRRNSQMPPTTPASTQCYHPEGHLQNPPRP
jgi:hypothetical protein